MNEYKIRGRIFALWIILISLILASFALGRYPVSLSDIFKLILHDFKILPTDIEEKTRIVIYNIRLPRIFLASLVGMALASSGAVYQGVFQNPMASPDILGATSGAAFGASLAILLDLNSIFIIAFAFTFSVLSVALAWLLSERAKGRKILNLVLAGMMVSSLLGAGTSYIKLVSDPSRQLQEITFWLMGSLTGANKTQTLFAFIVICFAWLPLYLIRWRINILSLGEEEARVLGMNTTMFRLLCIALSTILIAASVSVSGMISWIGLIIPHFCRKIVGSNFRDLFPASALLGSIFLLLVDNVSRNLLQVEIPIGILTALIGTPFFMYLFTRKEDAL